MITDLQRTRLLRKAAPISINERGVVSLTTGEKRVTLAFVTMEEGGCKVKFCSDRSLTPSDLLLLAEKIVEFQESERLTADLRAAIRSARR